MQGKTFFPKVVMHITRGCLVVPLQIELSDEAMLEIQVEILEKVNQSGVRGVIIDLTSIDILDSFLAQALLDTGRMASILGATTVIVGLRPELVSALVDLGIESKDILTAITLEQGFQKLRSIVEPEERPEEIEETEEFEEETSKGIACDSEEEPEEARCMDDAVTDNSDDEEESPEKSLPEDEI